MSSGSIKIVSEAVIEIVCDVVFDVVFAFCIALRNDRCQKKRLGCFGVSPRQCTVQLSSQRETEQRFQLLTHGRHCRLLSSRAVPSRNTFNNDLSRHACCALLTGTFDPPQLSQARAILLSQPTHYQRRYFYSYLDDHPCPFPRSLSKYPSS